MTLSFNLSLPVVRETTGARCRKPADAILSLKDLAYAAQECFVVLTLDTQHRLIDRHLVGLGLLDACLVHPREVFRPAIADGARAVIVCHNHPSGDPQASQEDLRITRKLVEAGRIIDIEVLDHLILGRPCDRYPEGYLSLREYGLVKFGP